MTPEEAIECLRNHDTCPCCYASEDYGEVLWSEIERLRRALRAAETAPETQDG